MAEDRAVLETVARRWIEEVWRPGDLATFDELHAPFRDRSAAGRGDTRDDYRRMLREFYAAFPDFHTTIEDLVVDEARATVDLRRHSVDPPSIRPVYQWNAARADFPGDHPERVDLLAAQLSVRF